MRTITTARVIQVRTPVTTDTLGVSSDVIWRSLRDSFTDGMMFIDESGRVSRISRAKLVSGNCVSTGQVNSLVTTAASALLYHKENVGCVSTGQDCSLVVLGTRADAGASVYQESTVKFDLWPYTSPLASYLEASELLYFVR